MIVIRDDEELAVIPNVSAKAETHLAILCKFHNLEDVEIWIPKSQIHDNSEIWKVGQEGDLVISSWLADRLPI